jgi:succinyl-diaminopimelate desuccinylase
MALEQYRDLIDGIESAEVARVCAELVQINTANPPGNERRAAEYVAEYLAQAGFDAHFLPYPGEPARASVVCRLRGEAGADRPRQGALVFNGHLDVVPVGTQPWRYEPFSGTIADGQVWGRGASDMKGGVAAMLVAARTLGQAGLPLGADLVFAATAGEEHGMNGAEQVAEWPDLGPVAAIIISEPTDNALGLAERGVLWIELNTYGQTAHGSTPQLGRNALNMMRKLLDAFDRLKIPFAPHPVLGSPTYSLNTLHAGAAQNVVPDHCVAWIDMRTVPGQDSAAILRQIEEVIADLARNEPGFRATVGSPLDLPSVDTPSQAPAVQRFAPAVQEVTGRPVNTCVVRFATEAAIFVPALNVPVLIYGPGYADQAHQPDEHASIAMLTEAARIYLAAALEILA